MASQTVRSPHVEGEDAARAATMVDELRLFVWPIVLGGRTPARPTGTHVDLELLDERRFGNGVVALRYAFCDDARQGLAP